MFVLWKWKINYSFKTLHLLLTTTQTRCLLGDGGLARGESKFEKNLGCVQIYENHVGDKDKDKDSLFIVRFTYNKHLEMYTFRWELSVIILCNDITMCIILGNDRDWSVTLAICERILDVHYDIVCAFNKYLFVYSV